jgi:hypothetical protein
MAMSRQKIGDESEARKCLLAIDAAGGDIRAWAREHGIDGRSLHAWRVNLARSSPKTRGARRKRRGTRGTKGLVELVPAGFTAAVPSRSPTRYVLEIGDARVEFGDDFSESTLRRVIGILRPC